MVRTGNTRARNDDARPSNPARRSLLSLGLPTLASVGAAAGALAQARSAAAAERPESAASAPDDAGTLTPQREAYYRRARF